MKILGVADLCERWGYSHRHSIYQKMKLDKQFPKPFARINKGKNLVWLESEIIPFEKLRELKSRGDFDECSRPHCYNQSKEEWISMTDEEKKSTNRDGKPEMQYEMSYFRD